MKRLATVRHIIASSVAAAVLLAASNVQAQEALTIGLVGGTPPLHWPYYIARDKHLFEAEGLKVNHLDIASSVAVMQQLTAGSLNIGLSGLVDPIRAIDKGAPVAIILINGASPPFSLFAGRDIKRIEDLKGTTIIVGGSGDITRLYAERILAAHGVQPGQYDLLYSGGSNGRFAALQSGAVQGAILGAPFDTAAEAAGFPLLALVRDYVKDLPFNGYVVNRIWALQNKSAAKKFLSAETMAVAWFYDDKNRDAAIKIMAEITRTAPTDVAKSYEFLRKIEAFERTGKVPPKSLQGLIDGLRHLGNLDAGLTAEKLILPGVTETD